MNWLLINQMLSNFIMYLSFRYMFYYIICNTYKLKINKKYAYILAFLCASIMSAADTLGMYFISGRLVPINIITIVVIKIDIILEFLILAIFILIALEKVWYQCLLILSILYIIMALPVSLIYGYQFIKDISIYQYYIIPLSSDNIILYITLLIFNIVYGLVIRKILHKIRTVKSVINKINMISKWSWYIIYTLFFFTLLNMNKFIEDGTGLEGVKNLANIKQLVFILMILPIIIFLFINHSEKKYLHMQNTLLEKLNETQYENYLTIQQQETEIHKLYHDMGNHIQTINVLISNNENQEAKEYMNNLAQQYQSIGKNYYCNNKIINAVLNIKRNICEQNNIKYDVDIKLPDNIPFKGVELMSVFSNLLDNAIESCMRNSTAENYIEIKSAIVGSYFTVKVWNTKSAVHKFKESNNRITWKRNEKMHGYGLKIITDIIERYDGKKEFKDNGDHFIAMVMLKI